MRAKRQKTREDVVAELAGYDLTVSDEELDVLMELLKGDPLQDVGAHAAGELEHEMNLLYAQLGRLLCEVTGRKRTTLVRVLSAWAESCNEVAK